MIFDYEGFLGKQIKITRLMIFTTGYNWLDLIYFLAVMVGSAFYVFKPWKTITKEEIRNNKKIIRSWSKYGKRGYMNKKQVSFETKYWGYGFLVTFFLIILPWIFQELGWIL
ncbi:hypothetical protein [Galbibacter orientalis]|uniref:hypothetical protein n=1 Tax=Galbibacter orientalis TaxID=453852 RepID=UPI0030809225